MLATLSAVAPAGASVASGSTDGDATAAGETEGAQQPATLSLWAWTAAGDEPVATTTVPADDADAQLCVKFNPHNPRELVTNSSTNVLFWNWDANGELLCIKPYVTLLLRLLLLLLLWLLLLLLLRPRLLLLLLLLLLVLLRAARVLLLLLLLPIPLPLPN